LPSNKERPEETCASVVGALALALAGRGANASRLRRPTSTYWLAENGERVKAAGIKAQ
jgi:hypothetical protein